MKEMAGDSMSDAIIYEKAKQLFDDLKVIAPSGSDSVVSVFKGWITSFQRRNRLHSVVRHNEAASADKQQHDILFKVI